LLLAPAGICSSSHPDFSGIWKQNNERCVPKRNGDFTLHITQQGNDLTVETTILRNSGASRHAVQRYSTDGKTSISTGADGDEFHTSVVWNGESLIFSVEEHEDGRILLSRETWTLIENSTALQREKVSSKVAADGTRQQTLIYLRTSPGTGAR
jgi:hypothetical protein